MDPITAARIGFTAAETTLALVDFLFRRIRFVRRVGQDPKSDGQYIRLITEKARFAEWKRRMNIESAEDLTNLMQKLPANARESLDIILLPMVKYMKKAETLFNKYGINTPDPPDRNRSFSDTLKRIDLLIDGGQRQLDDLLGTLKNCNDGLLTIAPPAPGYYISLAGNDQILETSQDAQSLRLEDLQRPQPLQSASQSPSTPRQTGETTAQRRITAVSHAPVPPEPSPAAKVFHPVIELLYSTCLSVLRGIAIRYPAQKTNFQNIANRLNVWGTGMFRGQVSLDQLKELFSFAEIASLPLQSLSLSDEAEDDTDASELLEQWTTELTGLTESLFSTLSTTEMVFKTVLACQTENPAIDEREMTLIKSESKISLSNMKSESARELLKIDLELIAAMQESLKDSKYAKHMEHRNPKFNAKQLYVELGEESRQIKYWASKLEDSGEQPMTTETQTAMMLNLARVARVFDAGFKSASRDKELDSKTKTALQQCLKDFPDIDAAITTPFPETDTGADTDAAMEVLRSSHMELRRLAGSKTPDVSYKKDFTLSKKEKMAAEEHGGISHSVDYQFE
ncbi:hypothetical protein OEA41_000217 [Lepraria neglecta]|uniref:Uncharacterized protein n=1 Tax=Lepraria neglecta TaxID=209136 RepID=A0AAD9ZFK3_9LECA|nr:hypothetical protein OEA41_000217 [Lepraria neglecta]